jgi:DNA-binding MarR family transcriptional regulator
VVVEARLYGRTHYYPPGYEAWNRAAIALLRRETARDVLVTLLERGPTDPSTVADGLEIARSTLEYHLDRLVEQGLVEKRRDSHNHVTLVLVRPAATAELLAEISPSLPERLVDRFTRLFDDLLVE